MSEDPKNEFGLIANVDRYLQFAAVQFISTGMNLVNTTNPVTYGVGLLLINTGLVIVTFSDRLKDNSTDFTEENPEELETPAENVLEDFGDSNLEQ